MHLQNYGITLKCLALVSISTARAVFTAVIAFAIGGLITGWILKLRALRDDRERTSVPHQIELINVVKTSPNRFSVGSKVQSTELCFGKFGDEQRVSISAVGQSDLPEKKQRIDVARAKLNGLIPLLQLAPSMLTAVDFGGSKYMRVVVNGPLAVASDAHFFLPFVRGTDGKWAEVVRLQEPRLYELLNTAVVWQFASVIVAQKYLADIKEKLEEIKKGIEDIKAFLRSERISKIRGALRYLEQASQAITQGELTEATRNELESAERELIAVQDHLAEDLRVLTEGIPRIKHIDRIGTARFAQNIQEHQRNMYELQRQWILCVGARAANWQVLSAFPGEEHLKSARKQQLLDSIREFTEVRLEVDRKMENKIGQVDSHVNRQETLDERKNNLQQQHREYQDEIASSVERMQTQMLRVADQSLSGQSRLVLALKLSGGEVLEAYELDGTYAVTGPAFVLRDVF